MKTKIMHLLSGLTLMIFLIIAFGSDEEDVKEKDTKNKSESTDQVSKSKIEVNKNAILDNGEVSNTNVPIAISEKARDELIKAYVNDDNTLKGMLVINGQVFFGQNGNEVRVLDRNWTGEWYKIRIEEGSFFGKEGWVMSSYLKPKK